MAKGWKKKPVEPPSFVEGAPPSSAIVVGSLAGRVDIESVPDEETRLSMEAVESSLLEKSSAIVEAALMFDQIDPDDAVPPPDWVKKYGAIGARRRLRVARASWMSAKEAPVGIAVAKSVLVGIVKARASAGASPKPLAIAIQMVLPSNVFPEKEIE